MDADNDVVRLCVRGMEAEARGENGAALLLFLEAWEEASDDYEACVAAHYVARHQATPEETLRWNQECLDRADRVSDERVSGFYASLYANMARAHRELGETAVAHEYFQRAAERVEDAPGGDYGMWNRLVIAEGLRGTAAAGRGVAEAVGGRKPEGAESAEDAESAEGPVSVAGVSRSVGAVNVLLAGLLARFCERRELRALGMILPAYLSDLGSEQDRDRLRSALCMVHAARWLMAEEQQALGETIALLGEEAGTSVAGGISGVGCRVG
ncbi:hypothetical protein [Streptomyces paromomycinus]|uniref:Tetratricopeptide repeat protein n=1 Tax=Streptomyces paromomycinus TaxID=92743 RepID=A0A401W4Z3_STREY|nr:hypothetical protein [Streptomyces paromomycinus]GCD44379.1 hypothetical protein GKJPGBOP_04075 [Streptomyces paromomycinus]